ETVLMRLTRGASLSGAAGIRPAWGAIIRPLLGCTRDEVRAYLAARRIPFVDDPMNFDPTFLRTRVRREVLPALEGAAGPGAAKMIARFAQLAAEDSELLDAWAEAAERRLRLGDGGLDAVGLQLVPRPLRRRIVARVLTAAGLAVDAELIARVDRALSGGREAVALPRGALLRLKGGRVRVDPRRAAPASGALGYLELEGDSIALVEERRVLTWTRTPDGNRAQRIPSPVSAALLIRRRRPGDRVRLSNGRTRKLQDVLTDARVPREARGALVVLADSDDQVVCVVGIWPKPGAGAHSSASSWLVDVPLVSERAEAVPVRYKG
ncbi:MAG TPA: tRNA lysidine(34) synthetase TilS, partial [Myxococcaceae bacterium]|nr:tRNA lysidine(34) synthetase TilS [Myxococcaceae bacterium]